MANLTSTKSGVANAAPSVPTGKNKDLMQPNAKDNPDTLTPDNPLKQTLGGSGKPKGPFGKQGREF